MTRSERTGAIRIAHRNASVIVVEFIPAGPDSTEVVFTYTHLERHGEMASMLRAAIANPGPGSAVESYAETVKRHAAAR